MDAGLLAETYSVEARMARQSNSQTLSHRKFEKTSSVQPFWHQERTEGILRPQRSTAGSAHRSQV